MPIISKTIDAENQFTAWKLFTEGANKDIDLDLVLLFYTVNNLII
jgi:hypothetical protein